MKTFLKYFITIVLIVAIIFGVKTLIDRGSESNNLYATINQQALEKIDNSKMQASVKGMSDYYNTHNADSTFPSDIKVSWSVGEMKAYLEMYQECDAIIGELKDLINLNISQTDSLVEAVKSYYNKTVSSLNSQNEIASQLNDYLKESNVSESDFLFFYNALAKSVKTTLTNYTNLAKAMSNFVLKDVYAGQTVNFAFIADSVKVNMMNIFVGNYDYLDEYKALSRNILTVDEPQFVLNYNNAGDINLLLSAKDKQEFVNNSTNESVKYLAQVLFGIGA